MSYADLFPRKEYEETHEEQLKRRIKELEAAERERHKVKSARRQKDRHEESRYVTQKEENLPWE